MSEHDRSILEQILHELRETRHEQHEDSERQVRLLNKISDEQIAQRKILDAILVDVAPEPIAISMTYDTSASPFPN